MKKQLVWAGHISFLVTAILALFFYKERVLYTDCGQQVFEMINEGGYKVFVGRQSMRINQTIPLLFIKAGAPLKTILISYSMSFIVVYYLCFIIAVYGFKNIAAGLGIAFVPILLRHAFGHSISEAWLGIAYSAVFYALLSDYRRWKEKGPFFIFLFYLLALVIIGINYFIHPITLFTVGFGLAFNFIYRKAYKEPYTYILLALVAVIYGYKFLFPDTSHEEGFFAGLKMADTLLPKLHTLPILGFFTYGFFRIYIFFVIILLAGGFVYFRKKNYLPFLFTLAYCMVFIVVASLAFYKQDAHFAKESRLMPLIFMAVVPLIEAVKDWKKNYVFISGLSLVLLLSYINLVKQVRQVQTRRINMYEKLLAEVRQYPERKFYSHNKKGYISAINSWGMATETLLLSSMEGKEHSRTIYFFKPDDDINPEMLSPICKFIWVPWYFYWPENYLNPDYFDLKCTAYREIENPEAQE